MTQADSLVPHTSHRSLTVDFHEMGFRASLGGENNQGFWFQMSGRQRQQSPPPWGPGNPQELNRYSYVTNNPLKYSDPSGHAKCSGGRFARSLCQFGRLVVITTKTTFDIWGILSFGNLVKNGFSWRLIWKDVQRGAITKPGNWGRLLAAYFGINDIDEDFNKIWQWWEDVWADSWLPAEVRGK